MTTSVPRLRCSPQPGHPARAVQMCCSPSQIHRAALDTLSIARVDCEAFYAAVEKSDRPNLDDRPFIIGGSAPGRTMRNIARSGARYGPRCRG